jgi:hypothetical protein
MSQGLFNVRVPWNLLKNSTRMERKCEYLGIGICEWIVWNPSRSWGVSIPILSCQLYPGEKDDKVENGNAEGKVEYGDALTLLCLQFFQSKPFP